MSKASTRPFLGETSDVRKAFPDILDLQMKVTQDPYGYYRRTPSQAESHYTLDSLPPLVRCLNPRCQQGGLEMQHVLLHNSGEHTFYCHGHEGTPKGRVEGDPCDNWFTVSMTVTRK